MFAIILIALILLIIYLLCSKPKTKDEIGEYYEQRVKKRLETLLKVPVYSNIYIKDTRGRTSEIDLGFVTSKGIFAVECKSRRGTPIISIQQATKEAVIRGSEIIENPIEQNAYHIKILSNALNLPEENFYSIIEATPFFEYKFFGKLYKSQNTGGIIDMLESIRLALISFSEKQEGINTCIDGNLPLRTSISKLKDIFTEEEVSRYRQFLESRQLTEEEKIKFKEMKAKS